MAPFRVILPLVSVLQSQRQRRSADPEQSAGAPEALSQSHDGPPIQSELNLKSGTDILHSNAGQPTLGEQLEGGEVDDEKNEVVPKYRYTPLVSGIAIPFCILLQIPGLTEHWYIRTYGNQIVETRANPAILDVGICLSMASAVLASMCLIVRFLEKRVLLSTILCLGFLTFHDTINIIAVTIFGVQHRFNDGFTYGQAFWITVCSTVVSFFTNISLVFDLLRTEDFEQSGSGLTRKQRSLVIMIIVFLSYLAMGALVDCYILNLTFIDGLYFSIVTIETIGFGDIAPTTSGGRVWVCFFATGGIITLAVTISTFSDNIMEALETEYRHRVEEIRRNRREMKRIRKVEARWRSAVEYRLRDAREPVWVPDRTDAYSTCLGKMVKLGSRAKKTVSTPSKILRPAYGKMHMNLEALSPAQLRETALDAGMSLDTVCQHYAQHQRKFCGRSTHWIQATFSAGVHPIPLVDQIPQCAPGVLPVSSDANAMTTDENAVQQVTKARFAVADQTKDNDYRLWAVKDRPTRVRRSQSREELSASGQEWLAMSYDDFQNGMEREEHRQFYAKLAFAWTLFLLFWLVGSAIFKATEKWSYGTAMWFCFVTFSTIGYGDYHVATPAGRAVFVVWAILGVATLTILISLISDAFSSRYKNALHIGVFDRAVKRYRKRRIAQELASRPRHVPGTMQSAESSEKPGLKRGIQATRLERSTSQSRRNADALLEALPREILGYARTFHEHVRIVMSQPSGPSGRSTRVSTAGDVPDGLRRLLDDIADKEKISDDMKREILSDEEARNTLCMLSLESELAAIVLRVLPSLRWKFAEALRNMIASAERSLDALAERDQLQTVGSAEAGNSQVALGTECRDVSTPPSKCLYACASDPKHGRVRADSDITVVEDVSRASGSFDRHFDASQPHVQPPHPHGLVISMGNVVEDPEPMTPADLRAAARRGF
ncbi:voltage-gated potassium channel [Punctularia strigosozonata HHB-11173 SS5]|uniref:voltage-gated potassium channel n=1 Tax=Punctularia strigosozonata (strain HHB-11173) TaxID=741275 RepID=UPI0004417E5F|nr:voltage-gated potassium channel [Punctularia strigosozonata HHB-11173 SS5]EIN08970.1 voltage-gated potassium channel [Punctularia strigosozonata HHB-11173 SS5]